MTNPMVAIYTRLSQDRDGTKTSTTRQEADCRALAKARGWGVAEVFTDRDHSAFNGKDRPAFARMLAAVDAGAVSGVVAWKVDRLGRRTADVVSLVDRLRKVDGFVATCDGLDTATPTGKAVVNVAAIFAELESDNTSVRTRRAKLQAAKDGRPSGGGRRPFGYTADGMQLVPAEADAIRAATSEILVGGSLRSIVARWNAKGVHTAEEHDWFPGSLRRLLLSGRVAGLRYYQGELVGEATWPAIITRAEHERLRAILTDPRRRTSRATARRYLLTGFLACGKCGETLVAAPRGDGVRTYACRSQRRGTGCGGVRILAEPLEELISEAVLHRLDSPAFAKARRRAAKSGPGTDLMRQLRDDEDSLDRLTNDYYVEKRLNRREFIGAHDALQTRIDSARRELASQASTGVLAALPGARARLRQDWNDAELDRRRAIIGALVETVTIDPVGRGHRGFSSDRVGVAWRS